jgi:hypothetical protein
MEVRKRLRAKILREKQDRVPDVKESGGMVRLSDISRLSFKQLNTDEAELSALIDNESSDDEPPIYFTKRLM